MKWGILFAKLAVATYGVVLASPSHASLKYISGQTATGVRYLVVEGQFQSSDNLEQFVAAVSSHVPSIIGFDSPGGNILKAIEAGRLIRALKLDTFQPRGLECSSACALAFLGGVSREAEPGAIGVHKSSFSETSALSVEDAVSAVQQLTAEIISYMAEMGADPALLQLSLKYESNDIRYLSRSEMAQYRVIVNQTIPEQAATLPHAPAPLPTPAPTNEPVRTVALPENDPDLSLGLPPGVPQPTVVPDPMPEPRSGRVRHPKGTAPVKTTPDGKSASLTKLHNGESIAILGNTERWYRVRAGNQVGYMHHTWVWVEQYESGPFDKRHIQVKSFQNLAETEAYIRNFPNYQLVAYLATNGWYAVTMERLFDEDIARRLVKGLREDGLVPDDAFVSYGNTYVQKVCCS
jgi:hypothetical protein